MENRAINWNDFIIPDEANNQPRDQPICSEFDKNQCYFTGLNIAKVNETNSNKNKVPIEQTENAGDFICNYIYYKSLEKSNEINKFVEDKVKGGVQKGNGVFGGCTSLFIHFPAFGSIDQEKQQQFLVETLEAISKCY